MWEVKLEWRPNKEYSCWELGYYDGFKKWVGVFRVSEQMLFYIDNLDWIYDYLDHVLAPEIVPRIAM